MRKIYNILNLFIKFELIHVEVGLEKCASC